MIRLCQFDIDRQFGSFKVTNISDDCLDWLLARPIACESCALELRQSTNVQKSKKQEVIKDTRSNDEKELSFRISSVSNLIENIEIPFTKLVKYLPFIYNHLIYSVLV
jgi:hypothetical protein